MQDARNDSKHIFKKVLVLKQRDFSLSNENQNETLKLMTYHSRRTPVILSHKNSKNINLAFFERIRKYYATSANCVQQAQKIFQDLSGPQNTKIAI